MVTIVGNRIKELRKERKISQQQLGDMLSVSQDTISLWERAIGYPNVEQLIALSAVFNVSTDYILGLADY